MKLDKERVKKIEKKCCGVVERKNIIILPKILDPARNPASLPPFLLQGVLTNALLSEAAGGVNNRSQE